MELGTTQAERCISTVHNSGASFELWLLAQPALFVTPIAINNSKYFPPKFPSKGDLPIPKWALGRHSVATEITLDLVTRCAMKHRRRNKVNARNW